MAIAKGDGQFSPMRNLTESARALRDLLSQRILVLDGAMGTMLQQRNLTAADFLNRRSAELARQAADEFSTSAKPRFVAGSMGPTTKAITVTGGVTFEELREAYYI